MRSIDADTLVQQLSDKAKEMLGIAEQCQGAAINYYTGAKYGFAKSAIIANGLPTIDAVPVVRCKDCKHNYGKERGGEFNTEDIVCDYWATDGLNADDFCSYGERSEDGET